MEVFPFINPTSTAATALMLAILGYLIKKWINGTSKELTELKKNKVDITHCQDVDQRRAICFEELHKEIGEVSRKVTVLTENIPVLAENQKNVIRILDKISSRQDTDEK